MITASIYRRYKKGYLVFGMAKTVSGFRIVSEPIIQMSESSVSFSAIANAVKSALFNDDSKRVPDPKNWAEFDKAFLQKTGLKSLKELNKKNSKYCSISLDNGMIIFTPSKPAEAPDKGFLHKDRNDAVEVSFNSSDQDIFNALELAFSRCE